MVCDHSSTAMHVTDTRQPASQAATSTGQTYRICKICRFALIPIQSDFRFVWLCAEGFSINSALVLRCTQPFSHSFLKIHDRNRLKLPQKTIASMWLVWDGIHAIDATSIVNEAVRNLSAKLWSPSTHTSDSCPVDVPASLFPELLTIGL